MILLLDKELIMDGKQLGKDQTYSRLLNNRLVISKLQQKNYSATDLANELHLSNATMSSIVKELLSKGLIKINNSSSKKEIGRKQVFYTINENYGLILAINISNYQAKISISNVKEEILFTEILDVKQYDAKTIYIILLKASQILMNEKFKIFPLKNIVISLPGRVNRSSGELLLSKQFDPELFKEQNFIQHVFSLQFPNVPIFISNDVNVSAWAELKKGALIDVKNAIYISIDIGIGGALIFNSALFEGDKGYAGEFGLIKVFYDNKYDYLDEVASLRVLIDKAEKISGENLNRSRTRLIELYKENSQVKEEVLKSATAVGEALSQLVESLDVSTIVIGGRATELGDDYLKAIQDATNSHLIYAPTIQFSTLGRDSKIIGATAVGVDYVLNHNCKKD